MLIILFSKKKECTVYSIQPRTLQCCEGKPARLQLIIFGDLFQNQVSFFPPQKSILHMTFTKLIQPTKEHSCYSGSQTVILVLAQLVLYNPATALPGIFVLIYLMYVKTKMRHTKPKPNLKGCNTACNKSYIGWGILLVISLLYLPLNTISFL